MNFIEFEVGGKQYRAGRLSAFQQLGIARRIAPIVLALGSGDGSPLARIGSALAGLSDEAAEYVVGASLANVERLQDGTWSRIWVPAAKTAKFDDLTSIAALMPIVVQVIQGNLGDFMGGALTGQGGAPTPAKTGEASPAARIS